MIEPQPPTTHGWLIRSRLRLELPYEVLSPVAALGVFVLARDAIGDQNSANKNQRLRYRPRQRCAETSRRQAAEFFAGYEISLHLKHLRRKDSSFLATSRSTGS